MKEFIKKAHDLGFEVEINKNVVNISKIFMNIKRESVKKIISVNYEGEITLEKLFSDFYANLCRSWTLSKSVLGIEDIVDLDDSKKPITKKRYLNEFIPLLIKLLESFNFEETRFKAYGGEKLDIEYLEIYDQLHYDPELDNIEYAIFNRPGFVLTAYWLSKVFRLRDRFNGVESEYNVTPYAKDNSTYGEYFITVNQYTGCTLNRI